VVIRDETGLCVAAMAIVIPHVLDPTTAEALGAWRAVVFCWDLGLSNFMLEGDSKTLVLGINEATRCLSRFGHIIDSIWNQLKSFHHAEVCYMNRNANQAAHVLAEC
jgi:ribonuclease HI